MFLKGVFCAPENTFVSLTLDHPVRQNTSRSCNGDPKLCGRSIGNITFMGGLSEQNIFLL